MIRMPHPTFVAVVLVLSTAAACIGVTAWQLLVAGPFAWHVHQPAFWQGGLEAAALAALSATVFAFAPRNRWLLALLALAFAFYLRRHSIDIPLLLDLLYIEIVVGLGAFVRRGFRLPPPTDSRDYLQVFVLGFIAWSLLAWTASACGAGSVGALRALTLLLAVPAACGGHVPLALYLWRRARAAGAADRAWCGLLASWCAVLYARSKFAYGHDSLWYGLRAEFVLAPGSSVFEPLGLVSPVHYFPKLYELFLLPLARIGDSSVLSGMTIWMLVLVLMACASIARRLDLPQRALLPVVALVATLPALANSTTPKPDVISALFVLLAADAALGFVQSRSAREGASVLATGTLACVAKMTAIPYVGALVLVSTAVAWRMRHAARHHDGDERHARLAISACVGALAVAAFVTARTWMLAGLPTIGPDPLFVLWTALGFQLAAPAGTLDWTYPQVWGDVPTLLLDWWFRPQRLPHVVIGWVGNVWLWCAVVAFALHAGARQHAARQPHGRANGRWPLLVLVATGAALALGVRYHVRGSDGNYFLAALVPAILISAAALFRAGAAKPQLLAATLACLPAFALFQASYAFLSGGWVPGTRAFDLELGRNWKGLRQAQPGVLHAAGLGAIGASLRAERDSVRVVGYAKEPASFWLPGRFEHLRTIGYSRPEYLTDVDGFLAFLREQRIDYLIMPLRPDVEPAADLAPAVRDAARAFAAMPEVERLEDRDYAMFDLRAWRAAATRGDMAGSLRAPPP